MNPLNVAIHETAHLLCGALALQRWHPAEYHKYAGEVRVAADGSGGHAVLYPLDLLAAAGESTPVQVQRFMASGPAAMCSVAQLQEMLRTKRIPFDETELSQPDINSLLGNGGGHLDIEGCEIMVATATLLQDRRIHEVARAVAAVGELCMPISQFFKQGTLRKALAAAGPDFMRLHARNAPLPTWAAADIYARGVYVQ